MKRLTGLSARTLALGALLLCAGAAQAQGGFHLDPTPRPANAPAELPLYPGVAPGSEGATQVEVWDRLSMGPADSGAIVRNVTRPTYSVFLPDPAKATGAAVILAPGGAFLSLSMQTEGWMAARWLADHGVAAFVLKYRVNPTPADTGAFMAAVDRIMGEAAHGGGTGAPDLQDRFAIEDGQAMVRRLRADAARYHIDPHRIGFVGFSAGAMTALRVTLADAPASRPDFVGLIYPPMDRVAVPADAPQLFVALASNDMLFGHSGFGLVQAWRDAQKPIEFHYYDAGDHGFGMRHQGTTSDHWIDEFYWWLQGRHLLTPATH
jgi:acetyl esterase/lipase